MALIKCLSCGRRMLDSQELRFCTNCGAPLQSSAAGYGQAWTPNADFPSPESERTSEAPPLPGPGRALVPRPSGAVSRPASDRRRVELELSGASPLPQPYEDLPEWPKLYGEPATIVTEELGAATPWRETRDRVPWWFPRRAPDIAGSLTHVQIQQESFPSWDISGIIIKLLTDMLWGGVTGEVPQQQQPHQDARVLAPVTTLRVRARDGTLCDARLRGDLTGANLTLGDKVSLWGWKRKGILAVRRGYNHTSRSVISSSAMKSPLLALLILLVLAAGLYLWMQWGHAPLWPM